MPIALIADIIATIGLGAGAIGGSVISYCSDHPGPGCVESRGIGMNLRLFDSRVGPCNVPMYNFIQCHDQLQSQSTGVIGTVVSAGTVQFDNIPPACMNLNAVLIGTCGGTGPRPEPCGSACMKYIGLSDAQLRLLSKSLNAS
ncbi:uncharacterized protein Triagg1_3929 [Trichoderma aggressivum f. europaeum]|uniref:Hydrophobin n=1 Tax=Trichoderma aggressivum f. europaeum TaxID=173218 RepID=A0AAE1M1L6_9HYPO|nr:hypothetical protein Triagg1_3929 [Trichoderma aggressivum f. europaeum]